MLRLEDFNVSLTLDATEFLKACKVNECIRVSIMDLMIGGTSQHHISVGRPVVFNGQLYTITKVDHAKRCAVLTKDDKSILSKNIILKKIRT